MPRKPRAPGEKTWMGKNWKSLVIALVIVGAGVTTWGALTGWKFISIPQLIGQPAGGGVFSVEVIDGMNNSALDNGDFDYVLYGTDNLDDWIDFEEIEDGDSLDSIAASDLADYSFFVVKYNGTVEIDNPKSEDDTIDVIYYERWAQILPAQQNILKAYRQPSSTGIMCFNSETVALVNITAGIVQQTNITLVIGSNATETLSAWVKGLNFENEDDDAPYVVLNFNETVSLDTFSIKGTSKARFNSTAIKFSFDAINATPQSFFGEWGESAVSVKINLIYLYFGETYLAKVT